MPTKAKKAKKVFVKFESDLRAGLVDPDATIEQVCNFRSDVKGIGLKRMRDLLIDAAYGRARLTYFSPSVVGAGQNCLIFVLPDPRRAHKGGYLLCEVWDVEGQGYDFVVWSDAEDLEQAGGIIKDRIAEDAHYED